MNASEGSAANTVDISVQISSPSASVSSFQFELVGLGCVEDITLLSVQASSEQGRCPQPIRLSKHRHLSCSKPHPCGEAGDLPSDSPLLFSEESAIVAASFFVGGPLPPGTYVLDIVAEPSIALPICAQDAIILSPVRIRIQTVWRLQAK